MRRFLAAITLAGLIQTTQAAAQDVPVVVELFTSQGCSSCPPADAVLHDLAGREDVIALALHVDYWDYIGWKDIFGRPENTARQNAYARAANATTVYTPQMVIGGVDQVVGSRPMDVMDLVQAHARNAAAVPVRLVRAGGVLHISAQPADAGDYVVQVVRYTPEAVVEIKRGENAGRSLTYSNIVTTWDVVGRWDGMAPLDMATQISGPDPVAVIIQQVRNGPIIGAARLR